MEFNRRFVIGDIHGAMRAFRQCIEKGNFDFDRDLLICLGDVCDGWPDVAAVFNYFKEFKNLIYILGNHDYWALEWMETGYSNEMWLKQGGWATINSYKEKVPEAHIKLLSSASFYLELEDKLFIHGGFNPEMAIMNQDRMDFLWDRTLVARAHKVHKEGDNRQLSDYSEIYVGHTPTITYGTSKPIKVCEVYMLDTGAGWPGGRLTLMDIESKEIFQSDKVNELYPEYPGRMRK